MTEEVKEVAADVDASTVRALEGESCDTTLPLVGRFDVRSRAKLDTTVEIAVDTSKLHYFDLESGAAVGGHPVEED
jgi:multiple sugar transport system ATP-binding protein